MERLPHGAGVVFRTFGRPEWLARGPALRRLALRRGLVFLVGADVRLARALHADGLHLPERGVIGFDRSRLSPSFLITAAAHDATAIRRAARAGLDAVVVSAIFPSASPTAGRPAGVTRLAGLTRATRCPIYALGGVNADTAHRLLGTGVAGFAAVEGLTSIFS